MATREMNCLASGGVPCKRGSFTPNTSTPTSENIGFVPTTIILWCKYSNSHYGTFEYDVANSKYYVWYEGSTKQDVTSTYSSLMYMNGTVLKYQAELAGWAVLTEYIAAQ